MESKLILDVVGFPDQSVFLSEEKCWYKLKSLSKQKNFKIWIKQSSTPFSNNIYLCDIKPSGKDKPLFKGNPILLYNLRRGLTFILDEDDGKKEIIRKGLQKFFDLEPEALGNTITLPHPDNTINYLWYPITKYLEAGEAIEVYITRKANGANAQISYCSKRNTWCIASKNVSIIVRSAKDLDYYKILSKGHRTDRFNYALEIAEVWFEILEKIVKTSNLGNVKDLLASRTLIGEYIGDPLHQHLIKYTKKTILFFAIVDNDKNVNCIDQREAFKIFNTLGLETVDLRSCGTYKNVETLKKFLLQEYKRISRGRFDVEEEGSVICFVRAGQNRHTVCLSKLKTLEYRLYRKIRELIRRRANGLAGKFILILEHHQLLDLFTEQSTKLIEDTLGKVLKICNEETSAMKLLPMEFEYYKIVASFLFNFHELTKETDKMLNEFADYLGNI